MNQDTWNSNQYPNRQWNPDAMKDSSGRAPWVCPKCHTINFEENCTTCGYVRKVSRSAGSHNPWKFACILLVVLLAVFVLFSSEGSVRCIFGHDFLEATCTEPQTCSKCTETLGDPLGHDYTKATCTKASECKRCHEKNGSPLSHKWIEATYTSPKKCSLCGKTEGNVKGYYATLPSKWQTKRVSVGGTNTTPLVFDESVKNCKKFTMYFQIAEVKSGDPYGKFTVYAKINSKWQKIGTYNATDCSEVVKTFEFDEPITFKQLAFVGPYRYSGNYSFYLTVQDFYLQD